jgi:hypothetical protein
MKSTFLLKNNSYQPLFPAYGLYVVVWMMGTAWLPLLPQLVLLRSGSEASAAKAGLLGLTKSSARTGRQRHHRQRHRARLYRHANAAP